MLLQRHGLAAQEVAPARIARVPHVDGPDVRQFVIHQREKALAGRESLHRQRQGRDIEQDHVARGAERGRIAVVGEILEQDRDRFPGLPVQIVLVKGEGVLESAPI